MASSDHGGQFADVVWRPKPEALAASRLGEFLRFCNEPDISSLWRWADEDFQRFWDRVIRFFEFDFDHPYSSIVDLSDGPAHARWCVGGKFNITRECLDKHARRGQDIALRAVAEDGAVTETTRAELFDRVSQLAGALRHLGVGPGDRVAVYLPMTIEAVVAFMAAARLGAITVPLFSGFGADAIAQRLSHSRARVLLSVSEMVRRGRTISTLELIEKARAKAGHSMEVLLAGEEVGPFLSWRQLCADAEPVLEPEIVDADAPLLLVYTSGTTGAPKGALLTHCGFAAKTCVDLQLCMDLRRGDRWLWMSDFGWIIGPIMVTASLMAGATLVLAEGAPDYPEPDRFWRLVQGHRVTFLGVAPTLIRSEMAKAALNLSHYDLSALRLVVSSGEPWTEKAWFWCFDNVCRQQIPIINWSGGTEISGGILTGTLTQPLRPLAFSAACPGMGVDVFDASGQGVGPGELGELVLRNPSIGLTRGLWADEERYLQTYWSDFPDIWKHGDLVSRDEDGHWYLHGRSDDVLKIAGKRTGPSEIENLLVATGLVSEAAVVGLSDERAGQALACVCVAVDDGLPGDQRIECLTQAVVEGLGRPYRPKLIALVADLPKTRSGKVLRRVVTAALSGREVGDLATLANPDAVHQLVRIASSDQTGKSP